MTFITPSPEGERELAENMNALTEALKNAARTTADPHTEGKRRKYAPWEYPCGITRSFSIRL